MYQVYEHRGFRLVPIQDCRVGYSGCRSNSGLVLLCVGAGGHAERRGEILDADDRAGRIAYGVADAGYLTRFPDSTVFRAWAKMTVWYVSVLQRTYKAPADDFWRRSLKITVPGWQDAPRR